MHIPEKERGKLSARSLICTFLGFAEHCKAYKLVHRPSSRLLESRNVIFNEGGPSPRFERITIESKGTPSSVVDSTPPSLHVRKWSPVITKVSAIVMYDQRQRCESEE